ncbi:hypothetical protein Y886_25755 [Xanthomonas hyacinthi DSM 19077]|nr:hypothetical protein Y886_25755 [Xanthomonas hyacinthi DSM 19077]
MAAALHLGEIRAGQRQDRVGAAQLAHLACDFLDALLLIRRRSGAYAAVTRILADPAPQRSLLQPILPAMDALAAHCDGY